MKFAIIAAGEGSRLKEEGIETAKPLIEVGGEKLIDRLVRIFMQNDAEEIVVICNGLYPEVAEHLEELETRGLPVRHVVKTTPSSMHSFFELREMLRGGKFILTTVDTIFDEKLFGEYVKTFEESDADALMGVTDYIDDEKPLYVSTKDYIISAFLDIDAEHECRYVSAGVYGLNDKALETLERCMKEGKSRMRNFQRGILEDGLTVKAFNLGKVFDVDHASDIKNAEEFIKKA